MDAALSAPILEPKFSFGEQLSLGWTKQQVIDKYGDRVTFREASRPSDNILLDDSVRAELRVEDANLVDAAQIYDVEAFGLTGWILLQFDQNERVVYINWQQPDYVDKYRVRLSQVTPLEGYLVSALGPATRSRNRTSHFWEWEFGRTTVMLKVKVSTDGVYVREMFVRFRQYP